MNWNNRTRLEHPLYLSYPDQIIDTVDLSKGFFCGTHNYVSFYAWNERRTPLPSCTVCDKVMSWSGHDVLRIATPDTTILEATVYRFRGKIHPEQLMPNPYLFDRSIEFLRRERGGEILQRLMKRLKSTCNCPSLVTDAHLDYFGDTGERLAERMNESFGNSLNGTKVSCPDPGHDYFNDSVWEMVIHLNDLHHWSREKIADWLEKSGNNPEFPVPADVPKEPGEQ